MNYASIKLFNLQFQTQVEQIFVVTTYLQRTYIHGH